MPDINDEIHHPAAHAPDEFDLTEGRHLVMNSPESIPEIIHRMVHLDKFSFKPDFPEFFFIKHPDKITPVVPERLQINYVGVP